MKTYLVTATPPTPNGDLHVGHLSGPFLAADVFSRFQRMRGNRSVYLTSSDDHQSYVMTTAKRLGRDPAELAASFAEDIKTTLRAADIRVDAFTSALGNAGHVRFVQDFFRLLHDRGVVAAKEHEILRCARCRQLLFESFVHGSCPFCGEEAAGNLCEACGRVYDPLHLEHPVCSVCGDEPSKVRYRGLFLSLERYRGDLEEFYAGRTSWRPHLRALCESLLSGPPLEYPVSYPSSWGIPVPVDGFGDQVVNVWLEMYPGQIHTTRAWAELQGDPELADRLWTGDATLVQFLGYDNSFFNAVLHVTLALALDRRWLAPEHVVTNEFYFLDGDKFSTSRNHAVWGRDILDGVDSDVLRYHLCRTNPEHWQTSFSYADLAHTEDDELGGCWNDAVNGLVRAASEAPGVGESDLQARGLMGWAASWLERFYDVEELSLRHASRVLLDYATACGDYTTRVDGTPRRSVAAARAQSSACLLRALAVFSAPLMPKFAQRLWGSLGFDGSVEEEPWDSFGTPFDRRLRADEPRAWFSAASPRPLALR